MLRYVVNRWGCSSLYRYTIDYSPVPSASSLASAVATLTLFLRLARSKSTSRQRSTANSLRDVSKRSLNSLKVNGNLVFPPSVVSRG